MPCCQSLRYPCDSFVAVVLVGIATDCHWFWVVGLPLPPSHIFQLPECAGRPMLFVIGPAVPVQLAAPDSKPELSNRLLPAGSGGGATKVEAPRGTAIAENDAAMPAHSTDVAPYRSLADWMAASRAAA